MGIKIGSSDISDVQVNVDGTLTPVNIVKIGGASTNLWERGGSEPEPWQSGVWTQTGVSGTYKMTWNGSSFTGTIYAGGGEKTTNLLYDSINSRWQIAVEISSGTRRTQYSYAAKAATSLSFTMFFTETETLTFTWGAT